MGAGMWGWELGWAAGAPCGVMGSEPCLELGTRQLGWDMALGSSWEDLGLSRSEQQGAPDCIRQVARLIGTCSPDCPAADVAVISGAYQQWSRGRTFAHPTVCPKFFRVLVGCLPHPGLRLSHASSHKDVTLC